MMKMGNLSHAENGDFQVDYFWSAENSLLGFERRIRQPGGQELLSKGDYTYDAFGRKLTAQVQNENGEVQGFEYQYYGLGSKLAAVIPEATVVQAAEYSMDGRYRPDPEIAFSSRIRSERLEKQFFSWGNGRVLSSASGQSLNGKKTKYTWDRLGSLRREIDIIEKTVMEYEYDPFGQVKGEAYPKLWGYSGKLYDHNTGFSSFAFRNYLATEGRFVSLDPIKYGSNWYIYGDNDPVNNIEQLGLAPRNRSDVYRRLYIEFIQSLTEEDIPAGLVCSTTAAWIYEKIMKSCFSNPAGLSEFLIDGSIPMTGYWGLMAEDFAIDGVNSCFYRALTGHFDDVFNSPNIEPGTIGVYDTKNPDVYTGHIITVVDVSRDEDGNVQSITIIEGSPEYEDAHMVEMNEATFDAYIRGTGNFIGWAEISADSITADYYRERYKHTDAIWIDDKKKNR
jgi:RHS repeat-associated protein